MNGQAFSMLLFELKNVRHELDLVQLSDDQHAALMQEANRLLARLAKGVTELSPDRAREAGL